MEENKIHITEPQTFTIFLGGQYEKGINEMLEKITKARIEVRYLERNQYKIDLTIDNRTITTIAILGKTKMIQELGKIYQIVKAIVENKNQ